MQEYGAKRSDDEPDGCRVYWSQGNVINGGRYDVNDKELQLRQNTTANGVVNSVLCLFDIVCIVDDLFIILNVVVVQGMILGVCFSYVLMVGI